MPLDINTLIKSKASLFENGDFLINKDKITAPSYISINRNIILIIEPTMIVVLFQSKFSGDAAAIEADITVTFHKNVEIELIEIAVGCHWTRPPSWDDLLVVIFNGDVFPDEGNAFVDDFMRVRGEVP